MPTNSASIHTLDWLDDCRQILFLRHWLSGTWGGPQLNINNVVDTEIRNDALRRQGNSLGRISQIMGDFEFLKYPKNEFQSKQIDLEADFVSLRVQIVALVQLIVPDGVFARAVL